MKVGEYCNRAVTTIDSDADLTAAAHMMRDHHVGFLIVLAAGGIAREPVGVLTDRDIVLQVLAKNVDPASLTVGDIMTRDPMIAREEDDLGELLQGLRLAGIRRVPVVDSQGVLVGIISVDDAIEVIAGLLTDVSGSIRHQQQREWRTRKA